MAKRKKPLNVFPVKTLEDADDALEKIADLKRKIKAEELEMNRKIDKIKSQVETKTAAHSYQIQALENGLQAFAEYSKDRLFKRKRSIDLNFGIIGFRRTTKLATFPKTTWKRVLELLEGKGLASGVRLKKSVNKDVLSEWSDEKLEKVNVRRKRTDDFWYEAKEEEIQAAS